MTAIQLNHRPSSVTAHVPSWFATTVVLVAVGTTLVLLGLDGRAEWAVDSIASGISWLVARATAGAFLAVTLTVGGICAAVAVQELREAADKPQYDVR